MTLWQDAHMTTHAIRRLVRDVDAVVPEWTQGDRLRKALDVSGLSAAAMAEVQDVDPATISRWMHDRGPVRRSALLLWSLATGVDQAWLETGTAGLQEEAGGEEYAIRDSNPEPADMEPRRFLTLIRGGNPGLPVDRIPAGHPIPAPGHPLPGRESAARLWAVS